MKSGESKDKHGMSQAESKLALQWIVEFIKIARRFPHGAFPAFNLPEKNTKKESK